LGSTADGERLLPVELQLRTQLAEQLSYNGRTEVHLETLRTANQNLRKFKEELSSTMTTQHKSLDDVLLLARQLFLACGYLPEGNDRTCARARAEECMAYIQKIIDEQE
jgi:hypothetical protein